MTLFRRNRRTRRGVAAVELALCLPVMVVFCLGSIEACSMIYLKQSLTIAAYEGARIANTTGSTSADVEATCNQIFSDRSVTNGTITISPAEVSTVAEGAYFRIECSAPCNSNSAINPWFFAAKTVSGSAEYMKKYNGQ